MVLFRVTWRKQRGGRSSHSVLPLPMIALHAVTLPAMTIKLPFQCMHACTFTAVHMRDSGLAVARDPNRIQLDPKFVGCTIAALVCGPIGNGCGCESRFVARVRTLTFRLPYPYRLFRSSTYTVKAYEPIPYGPFYMERYPPPPPPPPPRLACVHQAAHA